MSKKIKIEIKSCLNGSVLFEYEAKDNTIAKTVTEATNSSADLRYADLRYADLRSADLSYADLRSANLSSADLRSADLRSADLSYANLSYANLSSADLSSADLSSANLSSADLRSANLSYADLSYAENSELAIAMTRILPEGNIIGYKKTGDGAIVKLLISADAKRSHAFGRKCRAEYAEVLEIVRNGKKVQKAVSRYDSDFVYKVGETVRPTKPFDENWVDECSTGIHFFITKLEAENYNG